MLGHQPCLALPAHPALPCPALPRPAPPHAGVGVSPAAHACPHMPQHQAQDPAAPREAGGAEAGPLMTPQCWEMGGRLCGKGGGPKWVRSGGPKWVRSVYLEPRLVWEGEGKTHQQPWELGGSRGTCKGSPMLKCA